MYNEILKYFPINLRFALLNNITSLDENGATGNYTLKPDSFFYEDHFLVIPLHPVLLLQKSWHRSGWWF